MYTLGVHLVLCGVRCLKTHCCCSDEDRFSLANAYPGLLKRGLPAAFTKLPLPVVCKMFETFTLMCDQ